MPTVEYACVPKVELNMLWFDQVPFELQCPPLASDYTIFHVTSLNIVKISLCKENIESLEFEPFSSISVVMIDSNRYVQTDYKLHQCKHSSNLENLELQKFCVVL